MSAEFGGLFEKYFIVHQLFCPQIRSKERKTREKHLTVYIR